VGAIDGGLSALPKDSYGYYCGKNTTLFRTNVNKTSIYFSKKD
jgi:hypothetical protein